MIQSFAPGEVTPEQAMQIGEELCDRYLKGDYQYVIAVHNDKDHLHCHIIFNNTNLYNGLSFTTEHNQGRKSERAWSELREISDEICAEQGLSLIDPKGMGVSYLERLKQQEGKSWKEKLRIRIAEVMLYPAAGSQEQECEYRMDGYSFHDSRFIVRPAGRLFLPPSPPPGHR